MSAVGTYNDGTQKTISNVFWSTSASSVATISSGGLVTGVSPGQATISGAAGTVSGSNTVTVTLANLTSIKIDPISKTIIAGNSQAYTATGIANGKQVNLNGAGELNWTIDNMDNNLINIDNTGVVTTDTSISSPQLVHVQAQDPTTGLTSNTATLQVNNQ
jgi:hypothetical protein